MLKLHKTISAILGTVVVVSIVGACATAMGPRLQTSRPGATLPGDAIVTIQDPSKPAFVVAADRFKGPAYQMMEFDLKTVPPAPRLDVLIHVVTYSCGLKPGLPQGKTVVTVNQQPVTQFSFGVTDNGMFYQTSIDIDPKVLRVGTNRLEVTGYQCQYGFFEVTRFNGIALSSGKLTSGVR